MLRFVLLTVGSKTRAVVSAKLALITADVLAVKVTGWRIRRWRFHLWSKEIKFESTICGVT